MTEMQQLQKHIPHVNLQWLLFGCFACWMPEPFAGSGESLDTFKKASSLCLLFALSWGKQPRLSQVSFL